MPLRIRLHTESSIPIEVNSLNLKTMREQSAKTIAKTLVFRGNEKVPCGDFFDVSGSATDDNTVLWEGNLHKIKLIGSHHSSGTLRVEGNVGMHFGAEMTGGEIILHGDASDWLGAEMRGGAIHVHGNVGNLAGAVYRGGRKGMLGGEILIDGNAGNEIGHTMRRGLIAVAGNAGDAAGVGMIAGSIMIFGEPGIRNGAGMKRGTIALCQPCGQPEVLPTFKKASLYQPLFLQLYFRHLQEAGFPVPEECLAANYQRYCGDLLELGKGEIFTHVS
ncbi:formylmethanofuran dehydrogenase subunit C [Thalassoglobus polymorphus]|nr:formylmethanofuran dehydrogenase subunit C [Thalassoglobus polymorphus]